MSTSEISPEETQEINLKRKEDFSEQEKSSKKICPDLHDPSTEIPKLEKRLGGIFSCAVCFDMPAATIYQCCNGHLMCASCYNHILADARIKDESACCPNCRIEFSRSPCTRNLAVEKAVQELPRACRYCSESFPRYMLEEHQTKLCDQRIVKCLHSVIGCLWEGPHSSSESHQSSCTQTQKIGSEILPFIKSRNEVIEREREVQQEFMKLLSTERVSYNDVQLRPYRTEEFIHKLHYETTRFTAFTYQFILNMRLNDDKRDSHLLCDRHLSYQLVMRSKPSSLQKLLVYFTLIQGPFGQLKVGNHVCKFEFTESSLESNWNNLPLEDTVECNRLLACKNIDVRIILGQIR